MVTFTQVIMFTGIFWVILSFVASKYNLQRFQIFISSGFLIWKSERLKNFLKTDNQGFLIKFRNFSIYIGFTLFFAFPIILLTNIVISFIGVPAPIFHGNPLQTFSVEGVLLIIPAVFLIGSIHQFTRSWFSKLEGIEFEYVGFILIGIVGTFFSRLSETFENISNRKQLRIISSTTLVMLIILLLLIPLQIITPQVMDSMYKDSQGALVVSVTENGPADTRGIEKGDIITAVRTIQDGRISNDFEIKSEIDYYAIMRTIDPGEEFLLVLDDKTQNIEGVSPPETEESVFGTYLGIEVTKYRPAKFPGLSNFLPYYLDIFISWMINVAIVFTLYNLLPLPYTDGERMLKILLEDRTGTISFRIIQFIPVLLFALNFFLI